jgi:hypothetical protein
VSSDEQSLDIFRILSDGKPLWVEKVKNREEARRRIAQLIAEIPAEYRAWDPRTNAFVDVFARRAGR